MVLVPPPRARLAPPPPRRDTRWGRDLCSKTAASSVAVGGHRAPTGGGGAVRSTGKNIKNVRVSRCTLSGGRKFNDCALQPCPPPTGAESTLRNGICLTKDHKPLALRASDSSTPTEELVAGAVRSVVGLLRCGGGPKSVSERFR